MREGCSAAGQLPVDDSDESLPAPTTVRLLTDESLKDRKSRDKLNFLSDRTNDAVARLSRCDSLHESLGAFALQPAVNGVAAQATLNSDTAIRATATRRAARSDRSAGRRLSPSKAISAATG